MREMRVWKLSREKYRCESLRSGVREMRVWKLSREKCDTSPCSPGYPGRVWIDAQGIVRACQRPTREDAGQARQLTNGPVPSWFPQASQACHSVSMAVALIDGHWVKRGQV